MIFKSALVRFTRPRRRPAAVLPLSLLCAALLAAAPASAAGTTIHLKPPREHTRPALAPAVKAKPKVEHSPPWASRCESPARHAAPDCSVEQRVVLKQGGQLLAAVTVSLTHGARMPSILVQAPLGLALDKGITLKLNNRGAAKLHVRTCDRSGCYASTVMSKDFLDGMRTGKTLTVRFVALNNNIIKVPMPLDGFAAAYKRIQ